MTSRIFITPDMDVDELVSLYKEYYGYELVTVKDGYINLDLKKPKVKKPRDEEEEKKKSPARRTKFENRLRGKNNGV